MRIAAVGDVHGGEHRAAVAVDFERLGPVDVILLAGDLTDHNDLDAYGQVLETVRSRSDAPAYAVFGNNEYEGSHVSYIERFSDRYRVRFLRDEAATFDAAGQSGRIVGSTGSLDRPTWWQRRNVPRIEETYRRRIDLLDRLLVGDDPRILLTHYPPTYVTMGGEKEEWRPELGCKALEPVLLRRRPGLVIHGHIHKGIAEADLRPKFDRLDDFGDSATPLRVHNVAYPVRRGVATFDL